MAQGIQVFDTTGALVFDGSTYMPRVIQTVVVGTSDGSQAVALPANSNVIATPDGGAIGASVSGTTLSWSWGNTPLNKRSNVTVDILAF